MTTITLDTDVLWILGMLTLLAFCTLPWVTYRYARRNEKVGAFGELAGMFTILFGSVALIIIVVRVIALIIESIEVS